MKQLCTIISVVFIFVLTVIPCRAGVLSPQTSVIVVPLEPTQCDFITIVGYIPVGPFVTSTTHTVSGNIINITAIQGGLDFGPNPPQNVVRFIGKLPPGTYEVHFRTPSFVGNLYQTTLSVAEEDCDNAGAPAIAINISHSPLEHIDFQSTRVTHIQIPGLDGRFWATFQWDPKTLSFRPVDAGLEY